MEHKRADVLRSVLEGVTLNLDIILKVFSKHVDIKEITAIGGGAKGRVWRQIMADIYGIPVLKPNYLEEAASMGAAVTGGVGVGVFSDFSVINRFIEITDIQKPDESSKKTYEAIKPIFEECYNSLVKVYDMMAG
jgi:xylulokinase